MLHWPLTEQLDEQACYDFLLQMLHPAGLHCPSGHRLPPDQAPHDRHRTPVYDYRCRRCGQVFNIFTGTLFQKSRYRPSMLLQILRGVGQGVPPKHLADELPIDRGTLLGRRHAIQALLEQRFPPAALADPVTDADEAYVKAGEKARPHPNPAGPPRRRANQRRGKGNWDNDRPPVAGVYGRESGAVRLGVLGSSSKAELAAFGAMVNQPGAVVNTDEWQGYNWLEPSGRERRSVNNTPGQREWARDEDGDGIREVHTNSIEGFWTGLRTFLRPFHGISKWDLSQL